MDSLATQPTRRPRPRVRWTTLFLASAAALLLAAATFALSFVPGHESRSLRRAALSAMPGEWNRVVEVGLGRVPVWMARAALRWIDLPPEARLALSAVRRGDVCVFQRASGSGAETPEDLLDQLRSALDSRGWEPAVTVQDGDELVMVFVPASGGATRILQAQVIVIEHDHLVIASVDAHVGPIIELARSKWSKLEGKDAKVLAHLRCAERDAGALPAYETVTP